MLLNISLSPHNSIFYPIKKHFLSKGIFDVGNKCTKSSEKVLRSLPPNVTNVENTCSKNKSTT